MRRILVVARTEFLGIVRTKAFIIGILMVPLILVLSILFQTMAARQTDRDDHRFAVIDDTGAIYAAIEEAAAERNAQSGSGASRSGPHYLPEPVTTGQGDRLALRAELSNRVRSKSLFAFVELPASLLDPARETADELRYYTESASYLALPIWIRDTVDREVARRRLEAAAVDPTVIARLTRRASIATLGLVELDDSGRPIEALRVSRLQAVLVPIGAMALLFMAVMSAAPPLLTAVVTEKSSRISEVLLSSMPPFHLMAGKLIGVTGVSVLLALLYIVGGTYVLVASGMASALSVTLVAWFLVFLVLAVLMYGSIFIMIGSACTTLEESQTLMQPVMMLLTLPLLVATVVAQSPHSTLAVVLSLVPTATPFLMTLRLGVTPSPPVWQILLGGVLTLGATGLAVFAAGRIFRVGLLMQGKPPNLPELLRWIRR
jgi:ABC-2 type transport system permease protein